MLAGVPDLLRCIVFWLSLPGEGGGTRSARSTGRWTPPPDEELGDGLREVNRTGVSPDELRFSFSSMIRAGDFMSTFGSPTDVKEDFDVERWRNDDDDGDFLTLKADADVR